MNEKKVIKQFSELSDSAKAEASDFISFLHRKYKIKSSKRTGSNNKLKFYDIFKERDEMKDSTLWVSEVRRKNWGDK